MDFERIKQEHIALMRSLADLQARIFLNEPLAAYTTFNIGGPAHILVKPEKLTHLQALNFFLQQFPLPYYILGGGSNLLISDRGIGGVVIKLEGVFKDFSFEKETLLAGGGAELVWLRQEACQRGLSGLEFTVGIPGTVGGAIVMNAGISPAENMGKLVKRVEIMDKTGKIKWLSPEAIDFGYRHSSLPRGAIVLQAELRLKRAPRPTITKKIRLLWDKKKQTQPLSEKSAGCIFKNPLGQSAGALIEKAGLKGRRCGPAVISPLHANFIINQGGAKAKDVLKLMQKIREVVYNKFAITLEPEIVVWD
jgi:UDP-N-acetylmuramate dehydrogenase